MGNSALAAASAAVAIFGMPILASATAARTASFVGGIVAASSSALAPVLSLALGVSFEILVVVVNGLAEEGLPLDLGRMLVLHSTGSALRWRWLSLDLGRILVLRSAGSALRCRWNLSSPLAPALGCIFGLTLPSLGSKDITDDEGSQGDTYTCRRVDNPQGHSFVW